MTGGTDEVSNASQIRRLADRSPDVPALRHVAADGRESAHTWRELDDRSSRLAGALAGRGLGYGDRLGIGLRNSPQFVLAVFAAWKLGAVPVPIRWDLPEWEFRRLRAVVDAPVFLGGDDLGRIDEAADDGAVPDLPDVVSPRANGICSSGSTGTPKVILGSRRGVYDPVLATPLATLWGPVPRPQTILVMAPMYHVTGFAALFGMLAGDRLVVLEKFDAARVLDLVERHRVTNFTATPTMLQRIADVPGVAARDLSSLVWLTQGAAPMPPSLVHRWLELVPPEKLVMAYGMTENLGITALRADEWLDHQGSVGRGLRGTEIRIVGPDGGDLPTGETGEIYLRSASYQGCEYLGDAPRLRELGDGFASAGDLGHLDRDGYLYVVDRREDLIVTGGANVFPSEVEAALIDHPGIADVVVIGLRDEEWGRRVHAVVQPAAAREPPTAEAVIRYARERLAGYKVPKTVELVDVIPRSEATKVNRNALVAARGG